MAQNSPQTGWELLTAHDEATQVLAALLELDPGTEYTRSDIAATADVQMKTLYLTDVIDEFVALGLLDRVGGDGAGSEPRFVLNDDSDVLTAARAFDEAVAGVSRRSEEA